MCASEAFCAAVLNGLTLIAGIVWEGEIAGVGEISVRCYGIKGERGEVT